MDLYDETDAEGYRKTAFGGSPVEVEGLDMSRLVLMKVEKKLPKYTLSMQYMVHRNQWDDELVREDVWKVLTEDLKDKVAAVRMAADEFS